LENQSCGGEPEEALAENTGAVCFTVVAPALFLQLA